MSPADNCDRPTIGCFPLYPPLELFHSMGLTPRVLWALDRQWTDTARADRHLQNYCCSVARMLAEYVLAEGPTTLSALFTYNACDTLRNLPEILAGDLDGHVPMLRLHLPAARPGSDGSRRYLQEEIGELVEGLERLTGRSCAMKAFTESVQLYREMREQLVAIGDRVSRGCCTFADAVQVIIQSDAILVEDRIEVLGRFNTSHDSDPVPSPKGRVIVSGILPPPPHACEAMDRAGLRVVADDTALIGRANGYMPDRFDSVTDYYDDFYRNHIPCPTLLHTADSRLPALIDLARRNQARGFIFAGEKFCEYEYFEIPHLESELRAAGIRTLSLEFALGDTNQGAIQTRIDAFAELLENEEAP